MKRQSMPVKRRSVKKGAFRTLFANVARKKKRQRAATATAEDIEGDVPNLGVARALVVILVIHVVAIAGIFFHSHWLDGEGAEALTVAEQPVPAELDSNLQESNNMPKIKSGDSIYTVGSGDTYENIASRFGVVEEELRMANDNIEIRAGRYLKIPKKTIVAVEPAEIAQLRDPRPTPEVPTVAHIETPPAPILVETEAAQRADARSADPVSPSAGQSSYVVKSGDTFWSISKRYGTSVDAVMKANGITNPKRLRVGMSLTIPH